MNHSNHSTKYLESVLLIHETITNDDMVNYLLSKMNLNFTKTETHIKKALESIKENCNEWVYCDSDCFTQSSPLILKEINSTAYMLRILGESVIS